MLRSPGLAAAALISALPLAAGCALRGEKVAREELRRAATERPEPVPAPELVAIRAAAVAAPRTPTPTAGPLTVVEAMREAERTAERVAFSGEDLHRAELARVLATAQLMPRISWHYAYFRQEDDFTTPAGVRISSLLDQNRLSRFELRAPLFDGVSIAGVAASGPFIAAAEARVRDAVRVSRIAALRAFFAVLVAERVEETFRAALERDAARLREVRARQAVGVVRRTEVLFIETERARARANLDRAREEGAGARVRLGLVIGRPVPGALVVPTERLPGTPSLERLIAEAHERRQDIAATRQEAEFRRRAVAAAYAAYLPTVGFAGNLYAHREGSLEDVDWDLSIEVEAPIFEGLETTTRVRDAQAIYRQAKLVHEELGRAVADEVADTFHGLRATRTALGSLETALEAAEENYRLLEAEYRLGLASNLELVTAEEQLRRARLELEIARLSERLTSIELELAIGRNP